MLGVDTGTPPSGEDTGAEEDTGTLPVAEPEGCGCGGGLAGSLSPLVLLGLLVRRRRR